MRLLSDHMGLRCDKAHTPSVPANMAVFVVGDIHGQVQDLAQLHQRILTTAEALPRTTQKTIIYLGDYGDHGPDTCGVVDLLVSAPLTGFKTHYLLGDQDVQLLRFMRGGREVLRGDPKLIHWLNAMGGLQTLRSYGVTIPQLATPQNLVMMRTELLRKMPGDHISFYQNLHLSHWIGDFFFSHAGARSSREAKDQTPSDLLAPEYDTIPANMLEKVIIHSHAPHKARAPKQSRLCVGACPSGGEGLQGLLIDHQRLAWV